VDLIRPISEFFLKCGIMEIGDLATESSEDLITRRDAEQSK
jgi:hypothetical protein